MVYLGIDALPGSHKLRLIYSLLSWACTITSLLAGLLNVNCFCAPVQALCKQDYRLLPVLCCLTVVTF